MQSRLDPGTHSEWRATARSDALQCAVVLAARAGRSTSCSMYSSGIPLCKFCLCTGPQGPVLWQSHAEQSRFFPAHRKRERGTEGERERQRETNRESERSERERDRERERE